MTDVDRWKSELFKTIPTLREEDIKHVLSIVRRKKKIKE